jgi:hypothetical protein
VRRAFSGGNLTFTSSAQDQSRRGLQPPRLSDASQKRPIWSRGNYRICSHETSGMNATQSLGEYGVIGVVLESSIADWSGARDLVPQPLPTTTRRRRWSFFSLFSAHPQAPLPLSCFLLPLGHIATRISPLLFLLSSSISQSLNRSVAQSLTSSLALPGSPAPNSVLAHRAWDLTPATRTAPGTPREVASKGANAKTRNPHHPPPPPPPPKKTLVKRAPPPPPLTSPHPAPLCCQSVLIARPSRASAIPVPRVSLDPDSAAPSPSVSAHAPRHNGFNTVWKLPCASSADAAPRGMQLASHLDLNLVLTISTTEFLPRLDPARLQRASSLETRMNSLANLLPNSSFQASATPTRLALRGDVSSRGSI